MLTHNYIFSAAKTNCYIYNKKQVYIFLDKQALHTSLVEIYSIYLYFLRVVR